MKIVVEIPERFAPVEEVIAEVLVAARAAGKGVYAAALEAAIAALREEAVEVRCLQVLEEEEALEREYHKKTYPAPQEWDEEEEEGDTQGYYSSWREYYPSGN